MNKISSKQIKYALMPIGIEKDTLNRCERCQLLSYYYKTSNLLFLGCSLNQDRTMQVFQAVKNGMGDVDRPQHFSLEAMPGSNEELLKRNAYLLNLGITPDLVSPRPI